MRGRVRRDPHALTEHAPVLEASDGFAVALAGVCAHNLHRGRQLPRLVLRPSLQVAGVSAVEHVHDLAGAGIDRRCDEPAPPPPCRRCHDGLVEPDTSRRNNPSGIVGGPLQHRPHRRPHGLPSHPELAGQPGHRRLRRPQGGHRIAHSALCEHPARPRQARQLGPRLGPAPAVRARPYALVPNHPHRHPARRRSIAQHHRTPPLGTRPAPAHRTGHGLTARRPHLHNQLARLDALGDNRQPERAETQH